MEDEVVSGRILVKDVMSCPVVTIDMDTTVDKAAQLMDKQEIGSVIVTNKKGNPLGILTEKDLVKRVLACNLKASDVSAGEAMASPLITASPDETLKDAADRMSKLKIKRLGVMFKGNLVGVISSKDILDVMPELIEIMQQRLGRVEGFVEEEKAEYLTAGYCESCETWSDNLEKVEGNFLCEDCKFELKE